MKPPQLNDRFVVIHNYGGATADGPEVRVIAVALAHGLPPDKNFIVTVLPVRPGGSPPFDNGPVALLASEMDQLRPLYGPRPGTDEYFIDMAHLAARRSTCDRKHVGAVLTRKGHTVGTGYNGSPPGMPHCDDVGHDFVKLHDGSVNCVRTTHAEANAFLQAALDGKSTEGTTLYTNTFPCWNCAKMILGAGVIRVVFDADYNNDPRVEDALRGKGIELVRYKTMEVPR